MKPNSILILIGALFFAASITGCGKNSPQPQLLQRAAYDAKQSKITEEFNQEVFTEANISDSRAEQVLGPGDLVEIKVFEDEKLNAEVRVSSRGRVSLPLLGEAEIGGMTASEAEAHIENRYSETYIKDPHVSIFVKEHYSQRVTVVGEVENPGTYDSHTRQRLLDAIALAGGLTQNAGRIARIRKLEASPGGESPQSYMVDLDKLANEGKTELNLQINGGDVIFIPEAGSFFVDGAVRSPGKYRIQDVLTINEALLAAGGMAPYAKDDEIILMRKKESGQREEIRLELDEKARVSDRMEIQDGDLILVDSTFWGKLVHGAGITLGVPGAGVSLRDPER